MQYRHQKPTPHCSICTNRGKPLRACLSLFNRMVHPGLLLAAALVMVTLALGSSQPAQAVTKTTTLQPGEQAQSFGYFKALRTCMETGFYKNSTDSFRSLSQQNAIDFDWFSSTQHLNVVNGINVGAFNDPRGKDGDGRQNCGDSEGKAWIAKAAALWGFSSGPQLLCAFGFTRENKSVLCTDTSPGAINNFYKPGGSNGAKMDAFWLSATGLGNSSLGVNSITPTGGTYRIYLDSFMSQCRPSAAGTIYSIQVYDEAAKKWSTQTFGAPDRDRNTGYAVTVWEQRTMTCAEIAKAIETQDSAAVKGYRDWLRDNNGGGDTGTPGGGEKCEQDPTAPGCETGEGASSCGIPGVGWILCPVLTAGAGIADSAYDFLASSFLETNVGLVNTDPNRTDPETGKQVGTGAYIAWGIMRSIANVAFIIAFLIAIFSQMSSAGISNYGVKKMLPRLIVGAILVNVSFFICQIAVDASNILGYSLKSLFEGVAAQVTASTGGAAANPGDESGNLAGIAALTLAGAGFAWINASALIVAVVGAVVSLLTIFVILIVRQVLIVLLIVVAPLAFVAYLLPNTQPLFDRWRKMLTTLLILFPLIGLLYGASLLASAIILQIAGDDIVWRIAGYMALVIPLIAIFPLLKGTLDGVGKLGGAIQSFGSKTRSSGQKGAQKGISSYKSSGLGKFRAGVKADRKARIAAGTFRGSNRNPLNWGRNVKARTNDALNSSRVFNTVTGGYGADRDLAAESQNRKDQAEAIAMFGGDDELVKAWAQSGGDDNHAAVANLGPAQQAQFRKMRDAGHHRKATSHLAAVQYLSENGKGDAATVGSALARARTAGANETVVSGATQSAIAAYRKSGRGDAMADLSTSAGTPMTQQQGWSQVAASAVHRDGIEPGSTGRTAYEAHLAADAENTRKALVGFDAMEARAQSRAQSAIVAAAQRHQFTATGSLSTVRNIQEAKTYFGVK